MKKLRLLSALTATFLMSLWTVSCIDNLSDGEDLPNPYNFSYLYGKTILSDGTAIDSVNTTLTAGVILMSLSIKTALYR